MIPSSLKAPEFPLRAIGLLGVAAWGWYLAAMVRTSQWGYDDFLVEVQDSTVNFLIYALPLAFIPLIGVAWRRKLVTIAILTGVCLVSAELFGRGQEYLLIRKIGRHPTQDYRERRWWPFGHHDLGNVKGAWWGCD